MSYILIILSFKKIYIIFLIFKINSRPTIFFFKKFILAIFEIFSSNFIIYNYFIIEIF